MAAPAVAASGGAGAGVVAVQYLSFSYVLGALLLLALVLGPILYMFFRYVLRGAGVQPGLVSGGDKVLYFAWGASLDRGCWLGGLLRLRAEASVCEGALGVLEQGGGRLLLCKASVLNCISMLVSVIL